MYKIFLLTVLLSIDTGWSTCLQCHLKTHIATINCFILKLLGGFNIAKNLFITTKYLSSSTDRRLGANRPWCTMPGIFVGYNFLKAHSIPFKMTLVSTLTVGAFGRSSLLNALRT